MSSSDEELMGGWLFPRFIDPAMEKIYMKFHLKRQLKLMSCLWVLGILFNVSTLVIDGLWLEGTSLIPAVVLQGLFLVLNVAGFMLQRKQMFPDDFAINVLPYVVWSAILVQLEVGFYWLYVPMNVGDGAGWMAVLVFLIVALPVKLLMKLCLGVACGVVQIIIPLATGAGYKVMEQILASIVLFVTVGVIGLACDIVLDKRHRSVFVEARESLKVHAVIAMEKVTQERLLLSVIPKHVADEIAASFGKFGDGGFRKIYIRRHENVTILFADIVNFTAMASQMKAADLILTLNELFARFDKLATRHKQLRIKILGDCYYSVCGVPDFEPKHASLTVNMGLSMCKAIRYVQTYTNTGVNMRVGVHTGALLGGIIGQKHWQFEVWSKAVTMANKLESGGLPGRVHISQDTYDWLDGEFNVEPGDGASRDDYLRGTTTYLIDLASDKTDISFLEEETEEESVVKTTDDIESGAVAEETQIEVTIATWESNTNFGKHINPFSLHFRDDGREHFYHASQEKQCSISLTMITYAVAMAFIMGAAVNTVAMTTLGMFAGVFLISLVLTTMALLPQFYPSSPSVCYSFSVWVDTNPVCGVVIATTLVLLAIGVDAIRLVFCTADDCTLPSYFSCGAVVVVILVVAFTHIDYVMRQIITIVVALIYAAILLFPGQRLFSDYDSAFAVKQTGTPPALATAVGLVLITALALLVYSNALEKILRHIFLWNMEMDEEKEELTQMQGRNELLVKNILPEPVAKVFLNADRRDEDLYSHYHDDIGVIFASIPNFQDFYSEDGINNQGIECMRLLNEVISDFDTLFDDSYFAKDITKIKTIGSTYMVAAGINREPDMDTQDELEKWRHIKVLAEFGLALKQELDNINSSSFNHFVMRIGLHHGPIIAGVIGAKKPHFDIWGNTVNVASRMESTGLGGRLQVVKETMEVLTLFGFTFEFRGKVFVKGKGDMDAYLLLNSPN